VTLGDFPVVIDYVDPPGAGPDNGAGLRIGQVGESKSQNRRVPVRKQRYAVSVQPPGHRRVPIPWPREPARIARRGLAACGVDEEGKPFSTIDPSETWLGAKLFTTAW
jgi:hypothetical protein